MLGEKNRESRNSLLVLWGKGNCFLIERYFEEVWGKMLLYLVELY